MKDPPDPLFLLSKKRKIQIKDLVYKVQFYNMRTTPKGLTRSVDQQDCFYVTSGFLDSYVARPSGAVNEYASGRTLETPTDTLYIRRPSKVFIDIKMTVVCRRRRFDIYTIENLQNEDMFLKLDMFEISADDFNSAPPAAKLENYIVPFS